MAKKELSQSDKKFWQFDLVSKNFNKAKKARTAEWMVFEIRMEHDIDLERQDLAESIIDSTEKELGRKIGDLEAKTILANTGHYPEISLELQNRAIRAASVEKATGVLLNKPERFRAGQELLRALVLRKNLREGD